MAPKQRSPAKEILSALDADPALIEHYDPHEIEEIPLATVQARLGELGLSPMMPVKLRRILLESAPSPATDILRVLADDVARMEPPGIETRPLVEVISYLQRRGINCRAGIAALIDFVGEPTSDSAGLDKDQTKVRAIKSATLRSRKFLLLVTIGSAVTATAAVTAMVGFFVTREARQDKVIADQWYKIQELSAQMQGLKARLKESLDTGVNDLISLTMRVPVSGPLDNRTWPEQSDDSNGVAMGVRVKTLSPTVLEPKYAAAAPIASMAPRPELPVVAFVTTKSAAASLHAVAAFRKGLDEGGYVEDRNVIVEYHWLDGQFDRLPALMADLVRRRVAVIATPNNTLISTAAKAATATVPIVFSVGIDPVKTGLVASFARPGGNLTGIHYFALELTAKRLGLLHALAPKATRVAILVNPANGPSADETTRSVGDAARALGLQTEIINASTSGEIDAAFAKLVLERGDDVYGNDVLFISADGFLQSRSEQLVALTALYKIPAAYPDRAAVVAGGLMSYGADIAEMYREVGLYTANILKGAKSSDLPVQQSAKFEFVINRKTAKALALDIPLTLRVSATELID